MPQLLPRSLYLLHDEVDELSHEAEVPDWNLRQLADESLQARLPVQAERVGQRVRGPGEQVRLWEVEHFTLSKQVKSTNDAIPDLKLPENLQPNGGEKEALVRA